MSEKEVVNYMRQVCEGLKHMHENNIVYLDIKPENIMCTTKQSKQVKLIDFGLAAQLNPRELVKVTTGTAEFAAPEIVDQKAVVFYTDMWAAGILSYVLWSGLSPFGRDTIVETLKNVKDCNWEFDADSFNNISEEGKYFIRKLLQRTPEARLSAHECLEHYTVFTLAEANIVTVPQQGNPNANSSMPALNCLETPHVPINPPLPYTNYNCHAAVGNRFRNRLENRRGYCG